MVFFKPYELWPYNWVYLGNRIPPSSSRLNSPLDWVDVHWLPTDKDQIVRYLLTAPIFMFPLGPEVLCCFCGQSLDAPGMWRWDGKWLWQHELGHLVSEHSIRPPNELVDHIRNVSYAPPNQNAVDFGGAERKYSEMQQVIDPEGERFIVDKVED